MKEIVGVVIPTVDNSFFASLAYNVESILYEKGFKAVICNSTNDADKEKEYLRTLARDKVKGIICVSGLSFLGKELVPEDIPIVCVDRRPKSDRELPWVANDDREAMAAAAEYLAGKGCRHILLMPGYLAEKQTSPRVIGYEEALKKAGIVVDPEYILNRSGKNTSEAETEELVRDILRKGKPVDGIITSSDRAAFGAISALRSVGLYVPEDVRLISFDNSVYASLASPAITSLDRNPGKLAQKACEVLWKLVAGEKVEQKNIVEVSLISRDSTR